MPRLYLTTGAEREFKKLPKEAIERIKIIFDGDFTKNPFAPEFNTTKLKPPIDGYRVRVGDYRILFTASAEYIRVYRIRHRKDSYR